MGQTFRRFLKQYGWLYLPGIGFLILHALIKAQLPKQLGVAIDRLNENAPAQAVYDIALWMVLLTCLFFVTMFGWRLCVIGNARKLEVTLRQAYFQKLQRLPLSFYAKRRSGDLLTYAITDVNAIRMIFGPVAAMAINGVLTIVFSVSDMAVGIHPKMTFFALLPLPISIVLMLVLGYYVRKRTLHAQKLFAQSSGYVNESIMGIRVIKDFAREKERTESFSDLSDQLRVANILQNRSSSFLNPVVAIPFGISFAVSLIYGGSLVQKGSMTVGDLVAFQGYLTLIQTPITQIGRIINLIQRGRASMQRMGEIFSQEEANPKRPHEITAPLQGDFEFRDLTFTYPGAAVPALSHLSFSVKKGQTIGIAGTTGSGKSTLASLLLKLWDLPAGSIFADGKDLADYDCASIRQSIGFVPQDGFLFSSSIYENIAFYSPNAKEETVRRSAQIADIDKDILSFPEGYATQVGERGTRLSGGQKQRISFARALVRDPKILILDDTLSAVDTLTEQRITSAMESTLQSKTVFLISHRLSALQHADLILYLDGGKILEQGTHTELMQLGGVYCKTFLSQQKEGVQHEETH